MTPQGPAEVVAVVGATATGKSDLGIALALASRGEVINADALQLYRGMDVGTAKVPVGERQGIEHHQLDVLGVRDETSVAAYQAAASADIAAIQAWERLPILVGGSGLYVRAALDHLDIPPTDPAVRGRLEDEACEAGVEAMRDRLFAVDPVAAEAIQERNVRRIVRALEVIELTGRPFSATMPRREHLRPTVMIGLRLPRPELDARIDARVARMWAHGMLAEVEALDAAGLREGRTAPRAIGYAQALAQLDGELSEAEAIEQTAQATRRLVRRQESWFRADPRIHWLDADRPDLVDAALAVIERGAGAAGADPSETMEP
ncbi:tRNA (adenosine(37)-N6)-dimethylallyltransferase MiaA [Janibacter sp. GXQ6167]|uniref:tRNA (adenosine(37)-N6)-dimethylallyltransferase MiaA n=1 Tax=Janibacter sp. GXQ6167 TaxID=3240791 RepID=UPI0035245155